MEIMASKTRSELIKSVEEWIIINYCFETLLSYSDKVTRIRCPVKQNEIEGVYEKLNYISSSVVNAGECTCAKKSTISLYIEFGQSTFVKQWLLTKPSILFQICIKLWVHSESMGANLTDILNKSDCIANRDCHYRDYC